MTDVMKSKPKWWIAPLATVLFVLLVPMLIIGTWYGLHAPVYPWRVIDVVFAFSLLPYAALGWLIAVRRPDNSLGWICLSFPVVLGIGALSDELALRAAQAGSNPNAALWMIPATWLSYFGYLLLNGPIFLLFPDGHFSGKLFRWATWGLLILFLILTVSSTFGAGTVCINRVGYPESPCLRSEENPLALVRGGSLLEVAEALLNFVLMLMLGVSLTSIVLRYRWSSGEVRQQIKWVAWMAALAVPILIVYYGSQELGLIPQSEWSELPYLAFFSIGMPAAIGIAIFKYRLYDIDLLINRTLVYGTLMVFVIGIYILIVGAFGMFFQAQGNLLITLLATGLVAVLFQPLRERLQHSVNRLIFGERDDPIEAMSRLGKRLESSLVPEAVLPSLVETIAQTLKLPYVAITLSGEAGERVTASHGHPAHDAVRFPLTFRGQTTGQLVLAPRHPDTSFSSAEMRLLRNVARQAGAAVHAVRLTNDLLRSRQRLVTAREEERRRLRRDLHDGLGPTLAALHVQASALRRLIHTDPEAAEMMVAEFDDEIREAIDDIRRVVYELRPPTLDDLGLVGAARAYAAHCSRQVYQQANQDPHQHHNEGALSIHVEAPGELPLLPAAVEVAAYHVIREALTNIVHHAQARQCVVRFQVKEALVVEIVDDGIGLSVDHQVGVGLLSMRERAEELGGRFVIELGRGGGTRVMAQFPFQEA